MPGIDEIAVVRSVNPVFVRSKHPDKGTVRRRAAKQASGPDVIAEHFSAGVSHDQTVPAEACGGNVQVLPGFPYDAQQAAVPV